MRWKDIKLGRKFAISFGIVIVLLAVVALWSIRGIGGIVGNAEEVIAGNQLRTNFNEKYVQHLKWTLALNDYITDDEVNELNVQTDFHKCAFGKWYYGDGRKHAETIDPNLKPILAQMEEPHKHLHESAILIEETIANASSVNVGTQKANDIFHGKTQEYLGTMGKLFGQLIDQSSADLVTDEVMLNNAQTTQSGVVWLSLVAIIMAILLATVIATGIIKPIKEGVKLAGKISEGDLNAEVNINQNDEIGQLAKALQNMREKLREIITEIIEGSNQIAAASEELSSSSSEQAASTEEVSSSMEQMIASIQQNSENAIQTEVIANKAAEEIENGYNNVSQTVYSMKEIAEKISVIEEIAEKTDLLAINAAIEAARAGEHGKGFAVVAMEVRKLAERSQLAASEINQVSKSSVSIAEQTGNKMGEIVPEIKKTSTLVQEIAAGSKEQSAGADQVNMALQQLNQINQSNAASSEELASQAARLKETTDYFKVDILTKKSNGQSVKNQAFEKTSLTTQFKEESISDEFIHM